MATTRCELCRGVFHCRGAFESHLKYSAKHRRHEDLKHRLGLCTYEERTRAERAKLRELIAGPRGIQTEAATTTKSANTTVTNISTVASSNDESDDGDLDISRRVDLVLSDARATDEDDNREGNVLLYYCYADVPNPGDLRSWQTELCKMLKLRGRIHVASEGINGTVAGSSIATDLYVRAMRSHATWGPLFRETDFKRSMRKKNRRVFSNLFVKECDEIIALGIEPSKISWKDGAKHLSPREFHKVLVEWRNAKKKRDESSSGAKETIVDDDLVLMDCRNMYESAVGRFDGALRCPTRHFTEFPAFADRAIETMKLREKKVLMYCTGGIRCERASAYLRSKGVRDCYQLRGGIARYTEMFESDDEDSLFRGRNFVFDRRLALERCGKRVVGVCRLCNSPWDEYSTYYSCDSCGSLCLVCADCRWKPKKGPRRTFRGGDGTSASTSPTRKTLRCEYCAIGATVSKSS